MASDITIGRLREVVNYDPQTGVFVWIGRGRGIRTGRRAGCVEGGYRVIRIDKVDYFAQRLAWLWVHGTWPRLIRFQDGNRDNCAIDNLREGFYVGTQFDHRTKTGRADYQKAYRSGRRDLFSAKERERKFGIDLATYSAMIAAQDNKCAICHRPETATRHGKVKALAVDHDHKTGKVRGLLCSDCNTGIGKLGEDRDRLLGAVRYLDQHNGASIVSPLKAVE